MRHINDKFSSKKNNFHVLCNMYDESKNIIHDLVLQQIATQIVHRIKLGKLRWIIKVHIENWYICIYSRECNFLNKICLVLFFFSSAGHRFHFVSNFFYKNLRYLPKCEAHQIFSGIAIKPNTRPSFQDKILGIEFLDWRFVLNTYSLNRGLDHNQRFMIVINGPLLSSQITYDN